MFGAHPACSHFPTLPDQVVPDVSLASCNKLEEFHALLRNNKKLPRSIIDLLSSITSPKLRKISLSFIEFINEEDSDSDDEDEDGWDDEDEETESWSSLDTTLSRLTEQVSKVEGKLTLQLNISRWGSEPVEFDHLLSQFLERGELCINSTQPSRGPVR